MLYKGSCHCGNVEFEVEGELTGRGGVHLLHLCAQGRSPLGRAARKSEIAAVGTYTFHRHVLTHRFCTVCGIHPYAEDVAGGSERSAYVNIRCMEGIDIDSIPRLAFDGCSA